MSLISPVRVRIEKDVIIKVPRNLKGKGTINVVPGQQVSPTDIIGTSLQSVGFRIIKLAQELKVSPQEVEKYMKKRLGDKVYKDELLAEKNDGLLMGGKKVIVSPTDGILDFISPQSGDLRITFSPKKTNLPAGVYGVVEGIEKNKGQVWIKTQASIVHGMFGTGRVRDGILKVISKRDELVGNSFISSNLSGHVLVGGSLVFKDAISASISDGISGIITGGVNAKDYKGMAGGRLIFPKKLDTDMGISLVVCEGFGSIPLGEDIYEFLSSHEGRFVLIDGNASQILLPSFDPDCINRIRKTAVSTSQDKLPTAQDKFEGQAVELSLGIKVRVIGNSYAGEQGKIIALDKTESVLPSGVRAYLCTIETKRHKIQVPVANLEIIDYSL